MNCRQENLCGDDWPTVTFVATFDFQFVNHKSGATYSLAFVDGKNHSLVGDREGPFGHAGP